MMRRFSFALTLFAMSLAQSAQAQDGRVVYLEHTDGQRSVVVEKNRGICKLTVADERVGGGFVYMLGDDSLTSTLLFYSPRDLGPHAAPLKLDRMTQTGPVAITAPFARKTINEYLTMYEASLRSLKFDTVPLMQTNGLTLAPPDDPGKSVTILFGGEIKEKGVASFRNCLATLPKVWSMQMEE